MIALVVLVVLVVSVVSYAIGRQDGRDLADASWQRAVDRALGPDRPR